MGSPCRYEDQRARSCIFNEILANAYGTGRADYGYPATPDRAEGRCSQVVSRCLTDSPCRRRPHWPLPDARATVGLPPGCARFRPGRRRSGTARWRPRHRCGPRARFPSRQRPAGGHAPRPGPGRSRPGWQRARGPRRSSPAAGLGRPRHRCGRQLTDLTLMVQDWGGPIGLGLACRRPELVSRLIIGNTFAWPLREPRV